MYGQVFVPHRLELTTLEAFAGVHGAVMLKNHTLYRYEHSLGARCRHGTQSNSRSVRPDIREQRPTAPLNLIAFRLQTIGAISRGRLPNAGYPTCPAPPAQPRKATKKNS